MNSTKQRLINNPVGNKIYICIFMSIFIMVIFFIKSIILSPRSGENVSFEEGQKIISSAYMIFEGKVSSKDQWSSDGANGSFFPTHITKIYSVPVNFLQNNPGYVGRGTMRGVFFNDESCKNLKIEEDKKYLFTDFIEKKGKWDIVRTKCIQYPLLLQIKLHLKPISWLPPYISMSILCLTSGNHVYMGSSGRAFDGPQCLPWGKSPPPLGNTF